MTDPIIAIRDSEINVEEIMQRLRARIRERRAQAQTQGVDYDRWIASEDSTTGGRLSSEVYYELQQLRTSAEASGVTMAMRDRKIPLLNPILFRIENLLHRLVIKYVNMFVGRQVGFNRSSVRVVSELVQALDASQARIETLEKQVSELNQRLAHPSGVTSEQK